MSIKCKKCSGSGEAFGGVCYSCDGSGEVREDYYTTVRPSESKNPALVAERQWKPPPPANADPAHVAAQLQAISKILEPDKPQQSTTQTLICTDHDFYSGPTTGHEICRNCGAYLHQFELSAAQPHTLLTADERS